MTYIPETEPEESAYIEHIGIKRRSGRYPWGSGKDPYQRSLAFKAYMDEMTSKGLTQTQIADMLTDFANDGKKVSTTDLRAGIASSTEEIFAANQAMATRLKYDKGMSNSAIAELMLGSKSKESTVRGWLANAQKQSVSSLRATADMLKGQVADKEFVDVGRGNHLYAGVAFTKFNQAVALLRDEGYEVHPINQPQAGSKDKMTKLKVLCKEGTTWSEARMAVVEGRLRVIAPQSDDGGLTFMSPKAMPISASSKRIGVRYDEQGGSKMDGVIELRRGVADLDLGANRYAQVRIAVDGTHYLKGMAMYADDLPAGTDMRFNTNKSNTGNKLDAMKPMKADKNGKVDPQNPFGSSTYPHMYLDKNGNEKQSILNIVGTSKETGNLEGRWDQWSDNLSSQMLSKQPVSLASRQLSEARKTKQKDLDEIMALTNPVVKKQLLDEYADSADAAAVHLKAASLPRQATSVILPMNSMRPNEIYAPSFDTGERVALVRHPHAGPFEIPELTVNNNNRTAKKILSNAADAVGIHYSVAEKLSGADFDGDTVLVIPNDRGQVKSRPSLVGLAGFDPKKAYKIPDDDTTSIRMTKQGTQTEMGKISNLITDMSIKGAPDNEMARAVKHSMVVIDAEKHGLNYKQSEIDNGILALKETYQGKSNAGANTLLSRASSEIKIDQIRPRRADEGGPIDPKTGEKVFVPTGKTYDRLVPEKVSKTGRVTPAHVVTVTNKTTGSRMEFAKDARELLSGGLKGGTPMEEVYASHANAMKALGNEARKESVRLSKNMPKVNPSSKKLYAPEVTSLNDKLKIAQRNAPLERRAQVLAGQMAKNKIDDNPQYDKDDIKKVQYQALTDAREITGANKIRVVISDKEWEAIQSGAVAHSVLSEVLRNADMERVKTLATPRYRSSLTPGQIARAKAMQASGRPLSEIAASLGIPRSTILDNINNA